MALTPTEEAQTRTLLAQQAQILSLASEEPAILSSLGATDVNLSQLPTAGAVADADILLLRQGSTDKSVAGSTLKSYAQPAAASETVSGIIELATNTEVQAGTDAARAVTPAGRRADTATTASDPTYADNSTKSASTQWVRNAMLAISSAAGFAISLSTNGYIKMPSWLGGVIIQWGSTSSTGEAISWTYPITFPSKAASVLVNMQTDNGTAVALAINTSNSTGSSTISGVNATGINNYNWIAIGY